MESVEGLPIHCAQQAVSQAGSTAPVAFLEKRAWLSLTDTNERLVRGLLLSRDMLSS